MSNSERARRAQEARAIATGDPKKEVSPLAMKRLQMAEKAIEYTKEVFEFGAGNQASALLSSNFNSAFRLQVVRNSSYWEMTDEVKRVAAENPKALSAAKAELAQGGNCGEHAAVAYNYLRYMGEGETLTYSAVEGFDHAFVLIGDLSSDSDAEIAVSDPWPTAAECTLWEDHFAHTSDRGRIQEYASTVADGSNAKDVIKAGLKLSAKGEEAVKRALSDKETQKELEDGAGGWIWEHPDAAAEDRDFDYYVPDTDKDDD